MATIREIAELAGVSRGTVDRVLNHRGSVNAATAALVNDIAKKLDYKPNRAGIAMLNAKKNQILCVRGNCDAEVDQMVLEFPILADYCMLDLGTKLVYATHGHLTSAEQLPPLREGDLFLQGHTHVPMNEVKNGIRCMNPGSVSLPKQDSWRGYMILETNQAVWKELDGTIREMVEI